MKKLLPVILATIGLGVGTGAGIFLKSAPDPEVIAHNNSNETVETENSVNNTDKPVRRSEDPNETAESLYEYVKLNNQFIVPVITASKVSALVVMSLTVEVKAGQKEAVYEREPKLRDAFLQVLFDHANSGGFEGAFTEGEKMNDLRGSLFEVAISVLGPTASDVLVIDIVRQDI